MTTNSAEIIARAAKYNEIAYAVDSTGRKIGLRRLKMSQQIKVEEWSPNLDGTVKITDNSTGEEIAVSRRIPLLVCASLAMVDENPITFPKSRAELDANMDMLDSEGMSAAYEAFGKIAAKDAEAKGGEVDVVDQAKN